MPTATPILLTAVALAVVAAGAAVADPALWPAVIALDALIVGAAGLDLALSWGRPRRLLVEADSATTWSRARSERLAFTISRPGRSGTPLTVRPDLPATFACEPPQAELRVPGRSRAELEFRVTAAERGSFPLHGLHVEAPSVFRLWRLGARLGATRTIRVHPDLKQLGEYALLARTDRLALIGVRRVRRVGGDTDFERLRDYVSDDPLNRMDWKATARRDHLTVREYQVSQSQTLVLMVDAGRMMTATAPGPGGEERSLLDHAIDAALMLAWVALHQNDRVGLIAYADGIRRYVPPGGGPRMLGQLVHALHDLAGRRVESRHEDAFLHLGRHLRKRSLVVALTHVLDEVNADHLERHAAQLVGRHLPLAVLLRDRDLHAAAPAPEQRFASAGGDVDPAFWRAGAACAVLNARAALLDRLRAHGCLVLDTDPARLTATLVSRYLEIKARHLL